MIRKQRIRKGIDTECAKMMQDHIQDNGKLSGGTRHISNRAFRNWNSSVYKYNKKNKSYVLKKEIVAGADVPKRIR